MISREEAKEKFTDFIRVPSMEQRTKRIHRAFDYIYDSIGSCSECDSCSIYEQGLYCKSMEIYVSDVFYCADFEREQNDS